MITETTKILMDEHENILKVMEALERKCNELRPEKSLDEVFFRKTIDFIRNYADSFHHAKEEDILFKEFKKCADEGCVHCDPTEQMLYEHNLGRDFVKGMEKALGSKNKEEVVKNARGYINLIKEHIYKENNILYPMADEALSKQTQISMLEKFEKITKDRSKETKKYLAIVKEFKKNGK